jgi:hypothetical protein
MKSYVMRAALAALFVTSLTADSAQAQQPALKAPTVQQLGLVTEDMKVTLEANAGMVLKQKAGDICTLKAGSVVAILGATADGKQRVQRTDLVAVRLPSKETCPAGATTVVDPKIATAWQKAAEAKDAAKKAGQKPKS